MKFINLFQPGDTKEVVKEDSFNCDLITFIGFTTNSNMLITRLALTDCSDKDNKKDLIVDFLMIYKKQEESDIANVLKRISPANELTEAGEKILYLSDYDFRVSDTDEKKYVFSIYKQKDGKATIEREVYISKGRYIQLCQFSYWLAIGVLPQVTIFQDSNYERVVYHKITRMTYDGCCRLGPLPVSVDEQTGQIKYDPARVSILAHFTLFTEDNKSVRFNIQFAGIAKKIEMKPIMVADYQNRYKNDDTVDNSRLFASITPKEARYYLTGDMTGRDTRYHIYNIDEENAVKIHFMDWKYFIYGGDCK